jgi:hypothetical protein
MKQRCHSPTCKSYPNYGGRGIQVCERWRGKGGFENFVADMGRRPSKLHSIDRVDNNGNYEPNNCRWATASEQARNRRPFMIYAKGTRPMERDREQAVKEAIRTELQRQAGEICFYDPADRELFDEGPREWSEFEGGIKLADRFDLDAVAAAAMKAAL